MIVCIHKTNLVFIRKKNILAKLPQKNFIIHISVDQLNWEKLSSFKEVSLANINNKIESTYSKDELTIQHLNSKNWNRRQFFCSAASVKSEPFPYIIFIKQKLLPWCR